MIARRCCCSWGSPTPPKDSSQQELAKLGTGASSSNSGNGLDSILQGCRSLRQLSLPPAAIELLANIETNADALKEHVKSSGDVVEPISDETLIWPNPTSQEELNWSMIRPGGGKLIHTQLCIVAAGPSSEEWFMGQLFVSERGISVESSSGIFDGRQDLAPSLGLLPWESIEGVENDDIIVSIKLKEELRNLQLLRLQVGAPAEADKIRRAWTYYYINVDTQFLSFASFSHRATHFATMCEGSFAEERRDTITPFLKRSAQRSFFQSADAPITNTFLQASKELPAQEDNSSNPPLCSGKLTGCTLAKVLEHIARDDDWFLCRFHKDISEARDLVATPWTQGHVIAGTSVRRISFKFDAPKDIPKSLAKMIGFPPVIDTTVVARLQSTDNDLTLFMHSCSLNVPFGDYQRIEDVLYFKANDEGGVDVSRWMGVKWVKAIPWRLLPIKNFLEKKVKVQGADLFVDLLKIMQKEFVK